MHRVIKTGLAFIVIGLATLACMPTLTPEPTTEPMPASTDEPTLTPIPTWTPTPSPTPLPEPTATFTPTLTSTPTATPTFTPVPTMFGKAGVVHAVLFYSPTCPHCHTVMTESLPPLQEEYGDQLQITEIDVSTSEGADLYFSAVDYFGISRDRQGVPTMVVGEEVLVGAREIPTRLPVLIEMGLAEGGVGWPPIPGFEPPSAE